MSYPLHSSPIDQAALNDASEEGGRYITRPFAPVVGVWEILDGFRQVALFDTEADARKTTALLEHAHMREQDHMAAQVQAAEAARHAGPRNL